MEKHNISFIEEMKELLSDPKNRIKLDDFVTKYLRAFLEATNLEHFPIQGSNVQKEDFLDRMRKYEEVVKDLQQIVILLARWSEREQLTILEKAFSRIAEADKGSSGINFWIHFCWYPIQILMYSAGLAALSVGKYYALKVILTTLIQNSSTERKRLPIIVTVTSNISDIHDAFKWIPGKEKNYVPRSEHLFEILEPTLEKLLFVGKSYELLFDDFEVYSALVYMEVTGRDWGPIGRFGWKHDHGDSPFNRVVEEAKEAKEEWLPLRVGMFNGSLERFLEVSKTLRERLNKLPWY
ncbi:MAG: hypothetical protein M1479_10455 [Actinobacteria bacterium]|nr:hypothetical protein [Actinomycetota bacterium]